MFAPESPDGIDQETERNRGRCDGDGDCRVEVCEVTLEEGYGTCDEECVDGGQLVVECVFHVFRGVEYEEH